MLHSLKYLIFSLRLIIKLLYAQYNLFCILLCYWGTGPRPAAIFYCFSLLKTRMKIINKYLMVDLFVGHLLRLRVIFNCRLNDKQVIKTRVGIILFIASRGTVALQHIKEFFSAGPRSVGGGGFSCCIKLI
jgi:hypothetical protein